MPRRKWLAGNKLDGGELPLPSAFLLFYIYKAKRGRLKAMTAAQMDFLGLKEFEFDEKKQEVKMTVYVDNVGDIPMQIQLKNHKLDSVKVVPSKQLLMWQVVHKGQLRVDDIVAETKKRGGGIHSSSNNSN